MGNAGTDCTYTAWHRTECMNNLRYFFAGMQGFLESRHTIPRKKSFKNTKFLLTYFPP